MFSTAAITNPARNPLPQPSRWQEVGRLLLCIAGLATASACGRYASDRTAAATEAAAPADGEHDHPRGMRGGVISSLGGDRYHAEAVVERGGRLVVYLLGADVTEVQEARLQQLTAYVKPQNSTTSDVILLEATPVPGDRDGMTSRFTAQLPPSLPAQPLYMTIPGLRIGDQRFALRLTLPANVPPAMPAGLADREAAELYLTPGGRYTEADIEANGHTTAAGRYAGFRASHDFDPAPGEAICPVTRTKASQECRWIVGGQTYLFCCPPCIDEFVALAKTDPDAVLAAEDYVAVEP